LYDRCVNREPDNVVQNHRHVTPQRLLDGNRALGCKLDWSAIRVRAKQDAAITDSSLLGEAEDLKASTIGQDRSVPTHELVEAAQSTDYVLARPDHQVIGIAQDHPRAGRPQLTNLQSLDCGLSPDRHEGGCLDDAMGGRETGASRGAPRVDVFKMKREWRHQSPRSLSPK
jgi:hypothetical protein